LIVNGGYPGSYLALAAVVAWAKHSAIYLNCHNLATRQSRLLRVIEKRLDSAIARRVKLLLTNSFTTQTSLKLRFGNTAPDSATVYNAIEPPSAQETLNRFTSSALSNPVLGLIAVLEPRKGHLFALKLIRQLNESRSNTHAVLRIIGADPYNFGNQIRKDISTLGLSESVQVVGHLEKQEIYKGINLVIIPSERDESFGLVAIESLSHGIPVVASSVGALPEILKGSPNASVVYGWSLEEWIEAIEHRLRQTLSVDFRYNDAHLSRFVDPDQMVSEYRKLMGITG
jgi:glycosyltransferase involved in cell wall biosynthesis